MPVQLQDHGHSQLFSGSKIGSFLGLSFTLSFAQSIYALLNYITKYYHLLHLFEEMIPPISLNKHHP
jgi:hypothetical protein